MDMTNTEYGKYVNSKSQPSPTGKNCLWAFGVGGLICTLGQGLLNFYKNAGLEADDAAAAVSVSLICLSAVLTGLGVFDKIAKRAGAGTLVPITGFANAVGGQDVCHCRAGAGIRHLGQRSLWPDPSAVGTKLKKIGKKS